MQKGKTVTQVAREASKDVAKSNPIKGIIKKFDTSVLKREHIFSPDYLEKGIMILGKDQDIIIKAFMERVALADIKGLLKEGIVNQIKTQINGYNAEIRVFIENGIVRNMNGFRGHSSRVLGNSITV